MGTPPARPPISMCDIRVSCFYDVPLPCPLAAPIQLLNTCHALARSGVPTTVYAGPLRSADCFSFYGLLPHDHLRLVPLFSRLPGRPDLSWRLRRMLREPVPENRHFLICRGETGLALIPRLRRLRLPASVRLVYEAHRLSFAHEAERRTGRRWQPGDPLPRPAERIRTRERAAIEEADAVLCLTSGVKAALERTFRLAAPSLVLPSGVTLPAAAAPGATALAERDIDVLYAGKLAPRKGVATLVAAMQHLPGRCLWVLGGTPAEVDAHRLLAVRHGVADRVTFTGFVAPAQVPAYLRRARVGVCPLPAGASVTSEEFTSPLKLLEMMAHGVPVVATDLPSVRAIVEHGHTAMLVPPDDPGALAKGLEAVLTDRARSERLRAAAAQQVAAYSWTNRACRLRRFLEGLVPETRCRPGARSPAASWRAADAAHDPAS